MKIIGFNFTKISAEKKADPKGKIKINSNVEITNTIKDKVEIIKDSEVYKFDFKYSINYEPKTAFIEFEGNILSILEKEKAKEVQKSWKKKKVPDEIRIVLFNLIMTKCNIKALQLEEELGIPSHVPLPRINPQVQQPANYTG